MKKLKLKHVMKACRYRLHSLSENTVAWYPNSQKITFLNENGVDFVSCVFSRKSGRIFSITIFDELSDESYKYVRQGYGVPYLWGEHRPKFIAESQVIDFINKCWSAKIEKAKIETCDESM